MPARLLAALLQLLVDELPHVNMTVVLQPFGGLSSLKKRSLVGAPSYRISVVGNVPIGKPLFCEGALEYREMLCCLVVLFKTTASFHEENLFISYWEPH